MRFLSIVMLGFSFCQDYANALTCSKTLRSSPRLMQSRNVESKTWFIKSYNFGGNLPIQFIENALYRRYARECNLIGKTRKQVQDILGYPAATNKEHGSTKYIYEAYRYKDSLRTSIKNTTIRLTLIFNQEDKVIEQSNQVIHSNKRVGLSRV